MRNIKNDKILQDKNFHTLDIKDRKILRELEYDARQSFSEVGKKVGLSKEVVLYRVRNLEKAGIIKGYLTHIDIYKVGVCLYPVLLKFDELTAEEEIGMIEYLKSSPSVRWIARCDGNWDLNIVLSARHAGEIATFFDGFEKKYAEHIINKTLMHTVAIDYFKRIFGSGVEPRERIRSEENITHVAITEREEKLLSLLAENARMPIRELADKMELSPPTVLSMAKKLEKQQIIGGYSIFSDFKARNHLYYKIWLNLKNMNDEKWKLIYSFLGFDPYVLWATRVVGYYDFSIELEVPSAAALHEFIMKLKTNFHDVIRRRDVLLVHDEVSISYFKR